VSWVRSNSAGGTGGLAWNASPDGGYVLLSAGPALFWILDLEINSCRRVDLRHEGVG